MKQIINLLVLFGACVVLTSCWTSTKISVLSEPGTEILRSDNTLIGVTDNTGKLTFKMDDDTYSAFLISHKPNTDAYVPFALDYKTRDITGTCLQEFTGGTIALAGITSLLVGSIALAANDDEVATPFMLAGFAGSLAGVTIGWPATFRKSQVSYDHKFKYQKFQNTNLDLSFKKPNLNKENPITDSPIRVEQQLSTEVGKVDNTSKSSKRLSQKSSKTFKDYASQIQGTYLGSGKLTQNKKTIETYENISVKLRYISTTKVGVIVTESNGNRFFDEESVYTITKTSNGYKLMLDGINAATIVIYGNKKLVYLHPRVNIDNDIYELSITGFLK